MGQNSSADWDATAFTNFRRESKEKQESEAKHLTATIPRGPRPATIEAVVDRRQRFEFNDQRALDWNKTIAEFMALDVHPFSVVDNVGFRRIIAKAEPRYQMPSGKYFSSTLIPQMHATIKNKIREMVSAQPSVSFTSDVWSDPSSCVALLSLTAHWITDDFQRKQVILAASPLEESHTGDYLGGMLLNILADYNIEKSATHVLLRDSGANMIKATRVADIDSISCVAHTMQLVINDSIMSQMYWPFHDLLLGSSDTRFSHRNVCPAYRSLWVCQRKNLFRMFKLAGMPHWLCLSPW